MSAITACTSGYSTGPGIPYTPEVNIQGLDDEKMDIVDHYLPIDKRAFQGVDPEDAAKALAGDGAMAFAIANEFGASNYITEARFWFQIAAENGDSRGMTYYAIYMEPVNCHRSVYWQRRAVEAGVAGSGERHEKIIRRLHESEAACRSKR